MYGIPFILVGWKLQFTAIIVKVLVVFVSKLLLVSRPIIESFYLNIYLKSMKICFSTAGIPKNVLNFSYYF